MLSTIDLVTAEQKIAAFVREYFLEQRCKIPWHRVFMEGLISESFERMTNEGENTYAKPIAGEVNSV
jgi:hypothetical protein